MVTNAGISQLHFFYLKYYFYNKIMLVKFGIIRNMNIVIFLIKIVKL